MRILRLKNKSLGGCHNEVLRSCEQDLERLYGRCPDAPGFLNLFPGIRTGAHPPKIKYTSTFQSVKGIFCLKEPTNDAKVHERDFVCFACFVGDGNIPIIGG